MTAKETPSSALQGIRVLDLSRVLAGPLCSMILADLGADVIKVESPQGDDTRHWGPPWQNFTGYEQSAYYCSINRNKRSIVVDLKDSQGVELVARLAEKSHILLENLRPGKSAEFGLDWPALRKRNPALVYCSISGFGQTGPYRDRPGYDYVVQAMSGLMSLTGPAEGEACRVGVPISDIVAGLFAVNSILAALRYSECSGQGQYLDVSLLETQIAALVNVAGGYLADSQNPRRYGNQHPNIVPYQVFEGSDRPFVVAAGNDRQFRHLCRVVERPDLAENKQYSSNPQRVKNREELVRVLSECFAARSADHWIRALLEAGVPAGLIQGVAEALEDPHIAARGLIQEAEGFRSLRYPVRLSETDARIRRLPPRVGENTAEVLEEVLGLSLERIRSLESRGSIRCLFPPGPSGNRSQPDE